METPQVFDLTASGWIPENGPVMKAFSVVTPIRAPAERIRALLTDAPGYPRWNKTVDKIDGRIAPGERITVMPRSVRGEHFQ